MKSLSQFSLFGLLLAASVGFAGVTFAGGHGESAQSITKRKDTLICGKQEKAVCKS